MIFEHPPSETENRRAEIRLPFSKPNKGWIRILSADGQQVQLRPGLIEMLNISPGGCGFRSGLRFPATSSLLMLVECELENDRLELLGHIRWRLSDENENGYIYGMRFLLSRGEKLRLQYLLNQAVLTMYPGKSKIHQLYRKASGLNLTD